jgi:hypothetical protein
MPREDRQAVYDGYLSFEGGVDSGFAPALIQPNELAWAVNTTCRGGWPTHRPGLKRLAVTELQGFFQGAGTYVSDTGQNIALSVSGRIYLINLNTASYTVSDITPAAPNPNNRPHAWFIQAANYLIVQDGQSAPILYNGISSRRSVLNNPGANEVPVGTAMAYGKGRLWVANGNLYYGSNLSWSDPVLKEDSIILFTDNDLIRNGGGFSVPQGEITGMAFGANIDTALGDGDLLVFTPSSIFAFDAPVDRTTWATLEYPLQRFALLDYGSVNQEGIVTVNGDLFFRAMDGVRSFVYARRDFVNEWGNTPISRQVQRGLMYDNFNRLYATSSVNFDNRFLMTQQPIYTDYGIYHRGLVALDFHNVSGMGRKIPPAWEGVWTGLRILQIITCIVDDVERCYILALNGDNFIELWELTRGNRFDFDTDDIPIHWMYETRTMTFGAPQDLKKLMTGDIWYQGLAGEMTAALSYRNDSSECWQDWCTWTDCAKYRDCEPPPEGECQTIRYFRQQTRTRIGFPQPQDTPDPQNNTQHRLGYQFQLRFEFSGHFTTQLIRVVAHNLSEQTYGDLTKAACATPVVVPCQTGCVEVECCPPDDAYFIDESG